MNLLHRVTSVVELVASLKGTKAREKDGSLPWGTQMQTYAGDDQHGRYTVVDFEGSVLFTPFVGVLTSPTMFAPYTTNTGTLAFFDIGGDEMNMELPTESPTVMEENRLLEDLRQLQDNEVRLL